MDLSNYDALRSGVGLIDRSDRALILLKGPDRLPFLQGILTNDVAGLAPGSGVYSAWLTPQGRMIADLYVVQVGDATILDVPRNSTADLMKRLDDSIFTEEVTVDDASPEWEHFALGGPEAGRRLEEIEGHSFLKVQAAPDVPLFEIYARRADAAALRERLAAAGALPVGADAAEAFRIEAGIPRWRFDLDEDTIPLEAALDERAISFTKGCYVGQEVIVRVVHRGRGRVARRLVGLRLPGAPMDRLPARGEPIHSDGHEVGKLTSVSWSPALQQAVALGYVRREALEAGAPLATAAGPAEIARPGRLDER